jgi:multidrug efflux pump subunit AcrA (membrane-fusion protein)
MYKILKYAIIVFILTIFTLGLHFFLTKKPNINTQISDPEVLIASVKKDDFYEQVDFPARIHAKQSANVISQVSGILTKISFKQGSYVKKGDILFEINEEPFLTKIRAPISGIIGISNVMEGSYVSKEGNQKLTTIASIETIYVDVVVPTNGINLKKIQDILLIDEEVKTSSFFRESIINSETDSIIIRGEFNNDKRALTPGSFTTATIRLKPIKAILIPQKATFRDINNNLNVWVLKEDNIVSKKQIHAEKIFENKWVVTDGLEDEELIVYDGIQALSENVKVMPIFKQIQ